MNSSPTITKVAAALVKAQAAMTNAKKDAINPFFKKNYADINAVREAILPALNENGISVIQPTCVVDGVDYVETILLHESGEFISSLTKIVVDKPNDAQRHGSGLSYARRYAMSSIANIGAEDDDANAATGKGQPAKVVATPVKWEATPAEWETANSLVENSTLDANKRIQAANSLTNAKTQKEWDKIITRLNEVQVVA